MSEGGPWHRGLLQKEVKDDEDSEMDNKGSKGENKVCVSTEETGDL